MTSFSVGFKVPLSPWEIIIKILLQCRISYLYTKILACVVLKPIDRSWFICYFSTKISFMITTIISTFHVYIKITVDKPTGYMTASSTLCTNVVLVQRTHSIIFTLTSCCEGNNERVCLFILTTRSHTHARYRLL